MGDGFCAAMTMAVDNESAGTIAQGCMTSEAPPQTGENAGSASLIAASDCPRFARAETS
jgi:hypothetical protein